ncbi:MAG: TonB-dependent receptor, partial [Muribaculaceae bacterium]|nr:TonB-dependent receptor [Muribaculaceae bacterium]
FIYRDTRDYIQRNIMSLSGGKSAAKYVNYGKVDTKGFNVSARYSFSKWLSLGGNFSQMNVRDNMPTAQGSTAANLSYRERMPNLPWMFADSDVTFYWHGLGRTGNVLTVVYDNQYTHQFSYYTANIGSNNSGYIVPDQFAHNLSVSYGIHNGRYNISLECRNFTNARLYDNFSLQKAGRAFYGKVRIYFGN